MSMELEHIKVGDNVLVTVDIHHPFRMGARTSFTVRREVTRVTKTQFTVGKRRFQKSSGNEIGLPTWEHGHAYTIDNELHSDQSEEYERLRRNTLRIRKAVSDMETVIKQIKTSSVEEALKLIEGISCEI